jgi:hypothetical protein
MIFISERIILLCETKKIFYDITQQNLDKIQRYQLCKYLS